MSQLMTLSEVFNNRLFRIPDYQRGYAWGEEQLNDFWQDLDNLYDEQRHYTGMLTLEPMKPEYYAPQDRWMMTEKGFKAYYVVDGQQRLTTAIILINRILSLFADDAGINKTPRADIVKKYLWEEYGQCKSFIFGYEKDNPSDLYFRTRILGQPDVEADRVPENTLYTKKMSDADDFFAGKLGDDGTDGPWLEELFRKLTTRLQFNVYEISEQFNVNVTFETMNNRGKPLSELEKLKNRLIYLSTLLRDNTEEDRSRLRRDINEVWKTVYEYLGRNPDNPLDDDEFLGNHWIMYFKYSKEEAKEYAKFLLKENFTSQQVLSGRVTYQHIHKYITSLAAAVKHWYAMENPDDAGAEFENETLQWLHRLQRFGGRHCRPLILAALCRSEPPAALNRFLRAVEQYLFVVFGVSFARSNMGGVTEIYREASAYYHNPNPRTIDHLEEQMLRRLHYNKNVNAFEANIKDARKCPKHYYSWGALKYFLYEYELHLQQQAHGAQKVEWAKVNSETIEHIYPQTPDDGAQWAEFEGMDGAEHNFTCNALGNLLLLSRRKNSEFSNREFAFKKMHKDKRGNDVGYFNGSYSEIEVSKQGEWTPERITQRGIAMLEFMEQRWPVAIKDKEAFLTSPDPTFGAGSAIKVSELLEGLELAEQP